MSRNKNRPKVAESIAEYFADPGARFEWVLMAGPAEADSEGKPQMNVAMVHIPTGTAYDPGALRPKTASSRMDAFLMAFDRYIGREAGTLEKGDVADLEWAGRRTDAPGASRDR